ncbi:hypothetical protein FACS189444_7020 [Spirochaetia bacterium]|nr:hypothetical protein FACS189444_7020 [Spirochaetia bacterium]
MQEVTRNSYSLYKRESGSRTIWYARFWDDQAQGYSSGRSTGQTTKAAAHRQVQKWLTEDKLERGKHIGRRYVDGSYLTPCMAKNYKYLL